MADDVRRVRVTDDEVAAAKLEIKLLERLERPVDPRLRVVADAKPAEFPPLGPVASAQVAAWREALQAAARGVRSSTLGDKPPLPSLRAHRNRGLKPLDISQVFLAGNTPGRLALQNLAAYLPLWGGKLDVASFDLACRSWAATLGATSDEADEEGAEQSLGK